MAVEQSEIKLVLSNGQQAGNTLRELQKQGNRLNREIKDLEPGTDEFIKKTKDLQTVRKRFQDIDKEVKGVKDAQKDLNTIVAQYTPFAGHLQKFQKGYQGVSGAIKGATISQKALNIAIAASGIGALIMLLVGLVRAFTSTQEGMDKVTSVTRPLWAIFQRLKGLVQDLAGNVFRGLALILKGDIQEGLKALGSGIKEAVTGVGSAIKEGAAAGRELDRLTKQIEQTQNDMILSQSRLNRELKEQREIAQDSSKTEAERATAGRRAIELLDQRVKAENDLLDMQIERMKLEQTLNDTSRADEAELNRLIAQKEENIAAAASERVRMNSAVHIQEKSQAKEMTDTLKSELAERQKAEEEYRRMVEKAEKDLQSLRISMIADDTERKIAEYERDLATFQGNEDQKTEYAKIRRQQLDTELRAISDKALQDDLRQMQEDEEIRRLAIEENFYSFLITEEEREHQLYELKREALLERLDLIKQIHGEESAEYNRQFAEIAKLDHEQHKKRLDDAREFAQAKKQLEQMTTEAVADTVNATLMLLGDEEDGRKKNIGAIKAFKAASLKISYLSEIQSIWETANANPANILFPGMAQVIAGFKTGAASIRFAAGLRGIRGASFAGGGPVFGPSHAMGGIPFRVKGSPVVNEMEGDEIIMTKGVYQDPILRAAASMINEAAGGRSFAMGGVANPTAASQSTQQVINNVTNNNGTENIDSLINEVAGLRNDLNTWQSKLEVKMSIQKIRATESSLNALEADVTF